MSTTRGDQSTMMRLPYKLVEALNPVSLVATARSRPPVDALAKLSMGRPCPRIHDPVAATGRLQAGERVRRRRLGAPSSAALVPPAILKRKEEPLWQIPRSSAQRCDRLAGRLKRPVQDGAASRPKTSQGWACPHRGVGRGPIPGGPGLRLMPQVECRAVGVDRVGRQDYIASTTTRLGMVKRRRVRRLFLSCLVVTQS